MWNVLKTYDMGEKFIDGVKALHIDAIVSVEVKREMSESFRVDEDVSQRCEQSPCLFNQFFESSCDAKGITATSGVVTKIENTTQHLDNICFEHVTILKGV